MAPKRRQYDGADPGDMASYAHERIDRIEVKLDKINSKITWASAGLAVLIFLVNQGMVNLAPLIKSPVGEAHAEPPHD